MERFHYYPPTPVAPNSCFTPHEFLTSVAALSSTHFLTVGPQHNLQLWRLRDQGDPMEYEEEEEEGEDAMEAETIETEAVEKLQDLKCATMMRLATVTGRAVVTTSRGPLWVLNRPEEDRMEVRSCCEAKTAAAVAAAFGDPGGRWFVSVGDGGGLMVWREATEVFARQPFEGNEACSIDRLTFGIAVSVLHGTAEIVIGGLEGGIHVVSGREFVHSKTCDAHIGAVRAVAEAPEENGGVFVSGGDDSFINEWDLREAGPTAQMGGRGEITSLDVGGPGGWYIGAGGINGVQIWERRMRELVWEKPETAESAVWALAFCGDHLIWSGQRSHENLQVVGCSNAEAGMI